MVTRTIDLDSKQATLQELLSQVREGVEIILVEGDKPVARLSPVPPPRPKRKPDLHPDAIWISDDFNDPLPDEFWLGEES